MQHLHNTLNFCFIKRSRENEFIHLAWIEDSTHPINVHGSTTVFLIEGLFLGMLGRKVTVIQWHWFQVHTNFLLFLSGHKDIFQEFSYTFWDHHSYELYLLIYMVSYENTWSVDKGNHILSCLP